MKRYTKLLSLLVCVLFCAASLPVAAANIGGKQISSDGACVMDFATGEILYEHNGNKILVPASMTKIMTVYCVYEAIENGEITLDTVVPISENVYNKSRRSDYPSVVPLYYNAGYTVDEMLDIVVVHSASAATIALAELLGGNEPAFVKKMNQKVAEMGLEACYYDSCGIASNEISPISMAKLARNIITDYPDILKRSSRSSVSLNGNTYKSTNRLLDTHYYEGADGLKTGTTAAAGYCFCGTAVRNGRRVISVTMKSASANERFTDTASLLDYGFAAIEAKYNDIYYTDMRTFINGAEISTYMHIGDEPKALIVAEELNSYGFDVSFDAVSKVLYIKYNKDKAAAPEFAGGFGDSVPSPDGGKAFSITENDICVVMDDGIEPHILENVYSIDGYMLLSVDELGKIYDFRWSNEDRAGYLTVAEKNPGQASSSIKISVNGSDGTEFSDLHPIIIKDRVFVPVRSIMEALNKNVDWNSDEKLVSISDDKTAVLLKIGSDVMMKESIPDGSSEEIRLDAAPIILNSKAYLPIRAVAESFGASVEWSAEARTVYVAAGI